MTAALMRACRNISFFSRPENCPSVSDVILISGGRLFHANGPATKKLRGPKPAGGFEGSFGSIWFLGFWLVCIDYLQQ